MVKRAFPLSFLLLMITLLFLTACGGTLSIALDSTPTPDHAPAATMRVLETRIATLQVEKRPLDMTADSDTIRRALLNSHHNWQTVWFDGVISSTSKTGGHETARIQMWVHWKTARFRLLAGLSGGGPEMAQISNGVSWESINLKDMTTQTQQVMVDAHNPNWQAPSSTGDTVYPHPLSLEINSPVSDLIFPQGLAQRGGTYTATGMETVAGRTALVTEYWEGQTLQDRFWIDTATGVILRRDTYYKDVNPNGPVSSIVAEKVTFDAQFPAELFSLKLSEKPRFSLDANGYTGAATPPPVAAAPPGADNLYFVIDRSPDTLQLAHLPGSCITGSDPCPSPQPVLEFPNQNNTVNPLIWSPDGKLAALVQVGTLYRFNPEGDAWKALAKFPLLRESVAWSPDSQWLAFVGQQQDERQDIYSIGVNAANLRNLTGGQFTGPGTSLWVDGFLADGRLLFEVNQKEVTQLYTLGPEDQVQAKAIPYLLLSNGILIISPDRQQIAFTEQQNGGVILQVVGLDLSAKSGGAARKGEPHRLAFFRQASVQQIQWSLDDTGGERLIFLVASGSSDESTVNTVYSIRPDGTDLRQLYQDRDIRRLVVTSDGQFVIAEGMQNGRLLIIPVDTGDVRLVEAPGMRLDERLLGVSWR